MSEITNILKSIGYPTKVMVIDFETYHDADYSLKKMSTIEYVMDKRFEFLGVGINHFGDPIFFCHGVVGVIEHYKQKYGNNLENITITCHNAFFDGLVLNEKFGINPPYLIDTLQLARHWEARAKNSAKVLSERLGLKAKGDTAQFKGLRYSSMTNKQKGALKDYSESDVTMQEEFFKYFLPKIANPKTELALARHTLDMYFKPQLEFDFKKAILLKLKMYGELRKTASRVGLTDKQIRANSFIDVIQEALPNGEHAPMKMGKNKMIPALAKNDEGMKYLLTHRDNRVRQLANARLAVKSWPLHMKRVQNMRNQSRAAGGCFPVALKYYGGHLGRWSGAEGTNAQNFGGEGRLAPLHPLIGQVKGLLSAPAGLALISCDYAQIEARILAWFAGQDDLLEGFAKGDDIYSIFASGLFKSRVRKPQKSDPPSIVILLGTRRGFGKNTILGCGFGLGASEYYKRCRQNDALRPLFDNGTYDFKFIEKLIKTYRTKYSKIPKFWKEVERAFKYVVKYNSAPLVLPCGISFWRDGSDAFIGLPSGRYIRYPKASVNVHGDIRYRWGHLWGGSIAENIVQATARDILAYAILQTECFNIVLHCHDSLIYLVAKNGAEAKMDLIKTVLRKKPDWAYGLPLEIESKISKELE